MLKLGVLISGRGSNLQSLIDATQHPNFPAEIVTVISNRPDAQGLERAEKANIPAHAIDHKAFEDRETFEDAVHKILEAAGVELLCNAGFMRILTDGFVKKWHDKQINIHPSLLPAFGGIHVHERVLEAGARVSGCTVHYVRNDVDTGPIIGQAAVPVLPDDTFDSLSARVLEQEYKLYPLCVRLIAENKIRIVNERVVYADDAEFNGSLFAG